MVTLADLVTPAEAEAEYRKLLAEGVSDAEARAMVYEEPAPDGDTPGADAD